MSNAYKQKQGSNDIYVPVAQPLKIIIPGRPVPKHRPRASGAGHKMYVYTPEETKRYERQVMFLAAAAAKGKTFFNDIAIDIKLYFADKKFGDIDNYAKSILDGLQGTLFENDKQVARLSIERYIDKDERAEIYIGEIDDE